MKTKDLKLNPANPRKIDRAKLDKLKTSISEFGKMMALRPIIYDPVTMHVLGGNMRLKAIQELGLKEISDTWVRSAEDLTEEEKRRFIVEDNLLFGSWDFDLLKDWDPGELGDWGLDLPAFAEDVNKQDEWVGMPDFDPKDDTLKIVVSFRNEDDRTNFDIEHNLKCEKKSDKVWVTWYPFKEKEDLTSLKYDK